MKYCSLTKLPKSGRNCVAFILVMKVSPYELEINNVVNQFLIFGFGLISADPVQCILSWLCFWDTLYNLHAWSNVQQVGRGREMVRE